MLTKLQAIAYYKENVLPPQFQWVWDGCKIYDDPIRMKCSEGHVFPLAWQEAIAFIPTAWDYQDPRNSDSDTVFVLIGEVPAFEQSRLEWALSQLSISVFWCDKAAQARHVEFISKLGGGLMP